MTKYRTAKQLGILPEERKALIAFVDAFSVGKAMVLNGSAHFYNQSYADDPIEAKDNECGTAGCIAGFVFQHARKVQGLRRLRNTTYAGDYIDAACDREPVGDEYKPIVPFLTDLYTEGGSWKIAETKTVVKRALRTGKVEWD